VVIGRALYDGWIDPAEALNTVRRLTSGSDA